jgi:hypothetical protein
MAPRRPAEGGFFRLYTTSKIIHIAKIVQRHILLMFVEKSVRNTAVFTNFTQKRRQSVYNCG